MSFDFKTRLQKNSPRSPSKSSPNLMFNTFVMKRSNNIPIPSPLNLSFQSQDIDCLNTEAIDFKPEQPVSQPTTFHSHFKDHTMNLPSHSQANICTICNFYIEEDLLELSCNHICHRDCFINNILTCKKCEAVDDFSIKDSIMDDNIDLKSSFGNSIDRLEGNNSSIVNTTLTAPPSIMDLNHHYTFNSTPSPTNATHQDLTPVLGPIDIPMTPSDQMIPDPLKAKNTQKTDTNKEGIPLPNLNQYLFSDIKSQNHHQQQQLLSPRTSFNKNLNKNLFDNLMKPRIKFLNEHENQKYLVDLNSNNENYKLNYLINIKPPKFFNSINDDKNLTLKSSIYDEIKFDILKNIINWNDEGLIDFSNLGKLILFEIIDISTNGSNWDQVRLFLFENSLLLIDLKGEVLIGQIHINKDIVDMTRFVSGIRLNLNNNTIPELQICSDIPLIISRLEYYFKKILNNQFIQETSVFQLTTNGWNLIKDNYSNLPVDILRFQNCIENNLEIPESLLIKSMPSPEIIPFNLIISITLLNNNSNLTNDEYKSQIINFLDKVRAELKPFDKLSLIFVGLDGSGIPCRKGSFIGSVEPNWSGWDSIYNEVKVQSNLNARFEPILRNGFDELSISLDKCKDLFPFLNSNNNNINKLIIINANNYSSESSNINNINNDKLTYIENQFKALLNNNEKNLSVDFFRIGDNYTPELEFGSKCVLQPSLINNDVLKIPYGCKMLRFNTFNDFSSQFISILTNSYQQMVLPNISLDILKIIGTRDIVKFFKIEVNGKLIEINNFSNLKIIMNNINVNTEKNIMLNLHLNLSNLNFDNNNLINNNDSEKLIDLPLLSYMTSWLNESDDYKVLNAKIYQDRSTNNYPSFSDGSLTPPMTNDTNDFFSNTETLTKNKKFYRKEIEVEIIKNLKTIISNKNKIFDNQSIIKGLINFIINCKRNLNQTDSDFNFDNSIDHMGKVDVISFKHTDFTNVNFNSLDLTTYIDSLLNELTSLSDIFELDEYQAFIACKDFTNWLV